MTSIPLSADSSKNASTSAAPGIHEHTTETAETAGDEARELSSSFDEHLAAIIGEAASDEDDQSHENDEDDEALPTPGQAALRALGLENPGTTPTEDTPLPDVLLYALSPYGGEHPEQGIVLSVAAELESMAMFIDGPLSISLEMMARRLRASMALAERLREVTPEA